MLAHTIRDAFATGTLVTITKNNGNTVTGTLFKVTEKAVTVTDPNHAGNVHVALRHIASVDAAADATDADLFADMSDDEVLTTAALAALFATDAKALRVELRRAGLGVGKGSTYALTPAAVRPHVTAIRDGLAARAS